MARNFIDVVEAIKEVAPEVLVNELENSIGFWAPESVWYNLSEYVNRYVEPSIKDATSVAIYARLCDCSEVEMKARFEANNL